MYRRVVPGLPVMMALGNALSDAAKKQKASSPKSSDPENAGEAGVRALRPPATPPASRAA